MLCHQGLSIWSEPKPPSRWALYLALKEQLNALGGNPLSFVFFFLSSPVTGEKCRRALFWPAWVAWASKCERAGFPGARLKKPIYARRNHSSLRSGFHELYNCWVTGSVMHERVCDENSSVLIKSLVASSLISSSSLIMMLVIAVEWSRKEKGL